MATLSLVFKKIESKDITKDENFYSSLKAEIIRYLNLVNRNATRITKPDKEFAKKLDFKDIKFSVKIRDIHKIGKKISLSISVLGREKHQTHVSKKFCDGKRWFIINRRRRKKTLFLSKTLILPWSYFILWKKTLLLLLFTSF